MLKRQENTIQVDAHNRPIMIPQDHGHLVEGRSTTTCPLAAFKQALKNILSKYQIRFKQFIRPIQNAQHPSYLKGCNSHNVKGTTSGVSPSKREDGYLNLPQPKVCVGKFPWQKSISESFGKMLRQIYQAELEKYTQRNRTQEVKRGALWFETEYFMCS